MHLDPHVRSLLLPILVAIAAVAALSPDAAAAANATQKRRPRLATPPSRGAAARPATAAARAVSAVVLAERITAAQLKDYLTFIAADEMEGRDTPSRGLDLTAKFLAMNLSRWGLTPAGDKGSFFQRIPLRRTALDATQTRARLGSRALVLGEDFLAARNTAAAHLVDLPLVYVGHGWVIKNKAINAYDGVDVRGKVLVVAGSGFPRGITFGDIRNGKRGRDWWDASAYAAEHGARAVLRLPNSQTLATWDRVRERAERRGAFTVEWPGAPSAEGAPPPRIPEITASRSMTVAMFDGESIRGDDVLARVEANDPGKAFDLNADKKLSLDVAVQTERVFTQNVVAVLPGSDPVLRNEYVALGAHYDHIGVADPPVNGDAVYNGADDDGSGTTALLAIAEAASRAPQRPRRSLLFVWHAGEEKGLWGSRYFTESPTVPLARIIAQLNIDMIGRSKPAGDTKRANRELSGPNEIYVIGSKMMSTALGTLSERVNRSYLNLRFNYRYDAPDDPNRFFFRSDHFNYARKNIPIIFYFDGVHEDYHGVGDSADKIDYQKMLKVTRTVFVTAWELAGGASRPLVDKKLPRELTGEDE